MKNPESLIQVILEPRQVGKTTMITQLLSQLEMPIIYESADAISTTNTTWIVQVWESARLQMKVSKAAEYLLVIDEIQKIDNWSAVRIQKTYLTGILALYTPYET